MQLPHEGSPVSTSVEFGLSSGFGLDPEQSPRARHPGLSSGPNVGDASGTGTVVATGAGAGADVVVAGAREELGGDVWVTGAVREVGGGGEAVVKVGGAGTGEEPVTSQPTPSLSRSNFDSNPGSPRRIGARPAARTAAQFANAGSAAPVGAGFGTCGLSAASATCGPFGSGARGTITVTSGTFSGDATSITVLVVEVTGGGEVVVGSTDVAGTGRTGATTSGSSHPLTSTNDVASRPSQRRRMLVTVVVDQIGY